MGKEHLGEFSGNLEGARAPVKPELVADIPLQDLVQSRRTNEVAIINPAINTHEQQLQVIMDRVRTTPVCLIIPPSSFLADERVFTFLGLLKVAAQLRNNGNPVDVLDLSGYSNYKEVVREYMAENPRVCHFGITATTPQLPAATGVLEAIREDERTSKVILGGPHATLTFAGTREDRKADRAGGRATLALNQLTNMFDVVVAGDGELAIFHAIDDGVKGAIDAENNKSPLFIKRGSLDRFPYPARDLVELSSYFYYIDGRRATSVIAQLGCPFECGFCGGRDSQFLRLIRTRSVENIMGEVEEVLDMSASWDEPIQAIMFYDDELNVSRSNLESLCRGLINLQEKRGIEMRFRGFIKAELFTQEQADLMYQAGFREILSGVESGSDKILDAMRKHTSREINSRMVQYAHNAGLNVKALMSIGHPGESEETIAETVEWVKTNLREGDTADITIITVYFGTPYSDRAIFDPKKNAWVYEIKVKSGETLRLYSAPTDQFKDTMFYKGVPERYEAYVWTDYLSRERLVELRDDAERQIRDHLHLPPITQAAALQFEHSMGQGLPPNVLRRAGQPTIYKSPQDNTLQQLGS